MKKFAAFGYDNYYPGGGWSDFMGFFDSREEAIEAMRFRKYGPLDNLDLVDTNSWEVVSEDRFARDGSIIP